MKILFLTDFYPPHCIGGYEIQCQDQAAELVNRGHDVAILTSRWQVGKGEVDGHVYRLLKVIASCGEGDGLGEQLLGCLRLGRRRRQIQTGIATRHNHSIASRVIRGYQPDIVFTWNMNSIGIGPALAAQEAGIPIVFNLLDYWLADLKAALGSTSNPFKRWYHTLINDLESFTHLDTRYLIVTSQAVKQTYIELGFPAERLLVITPGLSTKLILAEEELPRKNAQDNQILRLLFVGRLVPEKGLEIALQALAHVRDKADLGRVTLDIIGGGAEVYRLHLQTMIASLELQDRVCMVGSLTRQQVLERYTSYDMLLVPSLWVEPFGIIILEAMARGLAVIATNHGGPAEIISDGHDGCLVPPNDPVTLAHVIVELTSDPERMQQMRVLALQTVRERYALERVVDQVETYLQAVVSGQ
ncbi:MAG: glycosyltransferase family 4 protein [Anaerolineae bacterium]|nr:glycosyltransferase family 4 protein [Anaerolineae bacterium]